MKKLRTLSVVLIIACAAGVIFTGCTAQNPLGSEKNPIVWSFVPSGETERVAAGARSVADLLHESTGLYFATNVATEYVGVIEALKSDPPKAHMASLATFAYVLAAEQGAADAALVSVRNGSPTYNGQIMVGAASGINKIADLKGKTFARPDPLSASGWIVPMLTLRAEGVNPDTDLRIVDAGSHDGVATAVYNGTVVGGASYVDARTRIEKQFPDVMDKVKVIATSASIPNDGVQFGPKVSADVRKKIVDALLALIKTDAGKAALNTAYQWTDLVEKDDSFYDPFRQVLQASGLKVTDLMPKK